ncbi:hypothetical protein H4R24_001818 [Coemansia sp. RSA 988]|nr:hypothetical protein H4R24_001818 [Coemansia sp. RSA 988]
MRAQFKAGTTTAAAGRTTRGGSGGSSENNIIDTFEQVEDISTEILDEDNAFAELWAADQLDMGLLANLFGADSSNGTIEVTPDNTTQVMTTGVEDGETDEHMYGVGAITTEALRSLDVFEKHAAVHTENLALGQLDSAELSAALEQLCWGSLDIPSGISTEADTTPYGGAETDVEAESEGNPMELEELSLFSLFLADMKPFETFLESLSLHQLRQCAATVNSVLVRREGNTDSQQPNNATTAAAAVAVRPVQSSGAAIGSVQGDKDTTGSAFSLLREWLPASTADSVIAALQTAQLDAGTPTTTSATAAVEAGHSNGSGSSGNSGGAETDEQASEPRVETGNDGTPWLSFVYAQKGKTRRHRIRIDMERATLGAIPNSFRTNNCVYPRANCTRQAYGGNRWGYETECNVLGWRLAFLNQELLASRRGLLQAAVNSYRTAVAGRKSRRIARLEKSTPAKRPATTTVASAAEKRPRTTLPSPATAQGAKSLVVSLSADRRMRISVEVGTLEASAVDEAFRREHAVFPRALSAGQSRYGAQIGRWAFEIVCNELAWRLAWLNRSRLRGRRLLIQLCLDAYRERFAAPPWPLLECYRNQMAGDIEPGFFEYWRPRSQRKQMLSSVTNNRTSGSALSASVLPAVTSALSTAAPATPMRKPAPRAVAASGTRSAPTSVAQTPADQQLSASTPTSSNMSAPFRPRTQAPMRPSAVEQPANTGSSRVRSVRPHRLPVPATSSRPPPPPRVQRPKNATQPSRPPQLPTKPPASAQQRTGPLPLLISNRPSASSAPRSQPLSRTPRPPVPMRPRPSAPAAAISVGTLTPTLAPALPSPKNEDRAAKAQVAADMLTDVLRRLADSDPSLDGLLGPQGNASSQIESKKSSREGGSSTLDDSVLLDAKVAELEKLITELQRS